MVLLELRIKEKVGFVLRNKVNFTQFSLETIHFNTKHVYFFVKACKSYEEVNLWFDLIFLPNSVVC